MSLAGGSLIVLSLISLLNASVGFLTASMTLFFTTYNEFVKLLSNKLKNTNSKLKEIEVLINSKFSNVESIILKAIKEFNISES